MSPDTAKLAELHEKGIVRFFDALPEKEREEVALRLLRSLNLYIGKPAMQKRLPLDTSGEPDPTQKPQPAPTPIQTFP